MSGSRETAMAGNAPAGPSDLGLVGRIATMALATSFALGWAGALHWPEVANLIGVDQIALHDTPPSPSLAAAKPGKI